MNLLNDKVITGAEPFFLKGNNIGILLCHGFVGTPQSVRDLGEQLHSYGFTVLAPRLSGHGTTIYDMETAKHTDWLSDLEESFFQLKKTCQTVFVIGQSMGGALSLRLAAKFPEINGVMTINAALQVPAFDQYRSGNGPRFIEEGAPDIKDPQATEITYNHVPLTAVLELQKLIDETPKHLDAVRSPVLVLTSPEDHVVPPENSIQILQTISSTVKEQILLQNSYHVASLDYDKDRIAAICNKFVTRLIN